MPKAIPDGYHAVTPYLVMSNASAAIEFYKKALGATEVFRMPMPGGKVGHAELQIGNSRVMLADAPPDQKTAKQLGGSPMSLCIYTENVDALADRFVSAGGKVVRPLQNQFYGDRTGMFTDPEGFTWSLMQHIEDVTPEEMQKRMEKMAH